MEQRFNDLEREQHILKERVDNIERLEREANFTFRDVAHKATIILGNATLTNEELRDFRSATDLRLLKVERKVEDIDGRLVSVEGKVDKIDQRIVNLQEDMDTVKANLAQVLALLKPDK